MIKPPFWGTLNDGFNWLGERFPIIYEYPKTSASLIGLVLTYVPIKVAQIGIKKFAPEFYNKHLPIIEKTLVYGGWTLAALYGATHPQEVSDIVNGVYPVYAPGTATVVATATGTLLHDAYKPRKPRGTNSKGVMDDLGILMGYSKSKKDKDITDKFEDEDKPDFLERTFGI